MSKELTVKQKMGISLAKAMIPITKRLETGFEIDQVDDLTFQLRINICEGCENMTEDRHCKLCFCPVDYKAKLMHNPFKAAMLSKKKVECPDGRW